MKFSPQQKSAMDAVQDWYHTADRQQIFRLFGYAGTGKTTLAKNLAATVKGGVMYAAFTGKAAMIMRKNGCSGATTIHRTIYGTDEDEETGKYRFRLKPSFEFANVKLFIIDECSMVEDDLAKDLLSFGKPVLVLGDPAQLPPVRGAGYFTNVDPDVMLTEIHRQAAENPIVRIATDIRNGIKLKHGDFGAAKIITRREVDAGLVTSADQVLVGLNMTRSRYNSRLRELAGRHDPFPEPGDQLVALKNDSTLGIFNGGLWEVLERKSRVVGAINDHCIPLLVRSLDFPNARAIDVSVREECFTGKLHEVNFRDLRGTQQFDYGYALTVHKSQGSQWPNVCLFDESGGFSKDRERWLYTGVTRAAEKLTVVMH